MKEFKTAPLPFMGQKRRFISEVKEVLKKCPIDAVYVDLFGGSGLLSHTVKRFYPSATVIYNDYDNYINRIDNITNTNILLSDIREIVKEHPKDKKIDENARKIILKRIKLEELNNGYVDYITISSSILFSMKYVTNYKELVSQTLYNCVRQSNYDASGYLDGLIIKSKDYKELYSDYKDLENVIFLIDPPYLSTEVGSYKGNYWKLNDYLDVLNVLEGSNYLYFTSNKSQIVELCSWIESRSFKANPFNGATTVSMTNAVNYSSSYTDIMLYKINYDIVN